MPRPVRIDHCDGQIWLIERNIVVTAVPEDHIGLFFRLCQNRLVIHPGVQHIAAHDMRFIFFPFFDSAFVPVEIIQFGKTLHFLFFQIAVGHGMPDHNHPFFLFGQVFSHKAGSLAFA